MSEVIRTRLGVSAEVFLVFRRLAVLAMMLTGIAIVLEALATSLFLSEHGVSRLPYLYLILALATVPVSFGIERLLQQFPVRRLMFWLPCSAGIGVFSAAGLGYLDAAAGSFLGLIISQLYTLVLFMFFWLLVSGFLDETDASRITPGLSLAIVAGAVAGAGVTMLLVVMIGVLPAFMVLVALCLIVALETERSVRALSSSIGGRVHTDYREITSVSFPDLLRGNQMIRLLTIGTLLFAVCYGLTEYVVFGIYIEYFHEADSLASFLAFVFAGIQLLEVALILLASRVIVYALGPTTRNLVFPAMTFLTVGTLAVFQHLVAAVASHINYRSVFNSVLVTVNATNYAAIPRDYTGKVRLFGTGVAFPAGIALAAFTLLLLQGLFDGQSISILAALCAAAYLVVGVLVARVYLPAMLDNMEAGVLDLGEFRELPAELEGHAREYLKSADELQVQFGLEILARGEPRQIMEAISNDCEALVFDQLDQLSDLAIARLEPHQIRRLLDEVPGDENTFYLKLKLALGTGERVNAKLDSVRVTHPVLLAMWDVYSSLREQEKARLLAAVARHPEVISSCIRAGSDVALVDLVLEYIEANPGRLAEYLHGIRQLAGIERERVYRIGAAHLDDESLWGELLGLFTETGIEANEIAQFAKRFRSANRNEERQILNCLGGVVAHPDVLSLIDYLICSNRSADHMKALRLLERAPRFIRQQNLDLLLEYYDGEWGRVLGLRTLTPVMAAAVEDLRYRSARVLIRCIRLLDEELASRVDRSLESAELVAQMNAIEAISGTTTLRPLARLLQRIISSQYGVQADPTAELVEVLFEDHWLGIARQKSLKPNRAKIMDHILFLKEVKLFRELDFDSLQVLNDLFEPRRFRSGEKVFSEGDSGHHLFLVEKGAVRLESGGLLIANAGQGDFFGEMALIDESPRSADALCEEDCTLLALERRAFQDATEYYPQILRALNSLLADRIRELNAQTIALQRDAQS